MMTYQQEQNNLAQFILDNIFLNNRNGFDINDNSPGMLELFITPKCNQACEYCYLYKHGDELYPDEFLDEDTIFNNLRLLLDYLEEKNFKCNSISPFAGEIWSTHLGQECLNIILEKLKTYPMTYSMVLCSNMTFIDNEDTIEFFRNYIKELEKVGVKMSFSASVEGKYLDDKFRKLKNGNLHTDEFYKKLYEFGKEFKVGYHPMIYSKSAKYWKENYLWYIDNLLHPEDWKLYNPMMLEVRNDNWTDEDIKYFCEFLEWGFNYHFKDLKDQPMKIIEQLYRRGAGFSAFKLTKSQDRMGCSIQVCLTFRVGDLAWIPCHRTCYPENVYGKLKVEDGKITGLEAVNADLAVYLNTMNPNYCIPGCDSCYFKDLCEKGCLGAQLEVSKDMTQPCTTVCKMERAKILTLIKVYQEYGIFDAIENAVPDLESNYYLDKQLPKAVKELLKHENLLNN